MQSMRVVMVLLWGAIFLCSKQHSQCMTLPKALSVMLILCGALLFTLADHLVAWFNKKHIALTERSALLPQTEGPDLQGLEVKQMKT